MGFAEIAIGLITLANHFAKRAEQKGEWTPEQRALFNTEAAQAYEYEKLPPPPPPPGVGK